MEFTFYGGWYDPRIKPTRGLEYMAIDYHLQNIVDQLKADFKDFKEQLRQQHENDIRELKNRVREVESVSMLLNERLPDFKKQLDSIRVGVAAIMENCDNQLKIIERATVTV